MTAIELRAGDVVVWAGHEWRVSRAPLVGSSPVVVVTLTREAECRHVALGKGMAVEVVR